MRNRFSSFYIVNKPFWTKKGLVHGVGQKLEILLTFRFMKIPRDKEFGDVLVRKEAFLDNRNIDFRKRKNGIFPRGIVHDFGKKTIEGFSWIVFIKNRSKKVFADVLDRKKSI